MGMSEAVYGWYPPAKSRWTKPTKPGLPIGYEAECLYKHWDSRYNADKRGVTTPETPSVICIDLKSPPPTSKQSSRESVHGKRGPSSVRSQSGASSRSSSVKVPRFHTPPVAYDSAVPRPPPETGIRSPHHATATPPARPLKAWAMHTEVTPIASPAAVPRAPTPPKIYSPAQGHVKPTTQASPVPKADSPVNAGRPFVTSPNGLVTTKVADKKPRVQSAPSRRPTATPKHARPVKSAGPVRSEPADGFHTAEKFRRESTPPLRPEPTPPCEHWPKTPTTADCKKVLDYDTELKKHGWRMEIPGDPLGLKAPCIAPRLSITKKIPIPSVAPNPPTSHMQVFDTYFYNTIPRKPLSFTVHPEWVSEVLHAKRLALQKKEGLNFKHTNYSFAY